MADIEKQEDFILEWCEKHHGFDALTTEFHEQFYNKFGGKRNECFWGAQTVHKAMRLAKRMHDMGMLKRGTIKLGFNRQAGFPSWVRTYSVK